MTNITTKVISSNNNKDNKEDNSSSINKIVDFMPNYKKQEELYKKQKVYAIDEKTGKEVQRTWPYIRQTEQILYERWLSKVSNPVTGEFYPQRDENDNPVKQPHGKPNAQYVCSGIVRIKAQNGKEYLISQGLLQGFDSLGQLVTRSCQWPERWYRTLFATEKIFDNERKIIHNISKGPVGIEAVYELEFTPENLDRLYYQHALGVNNNRFLNAGYNNKSSFTTCILYVKDEQQGKPIIIRWHDEKESYQLLRNKPFDYLYNTEFMPNAYKAELIHRHQQYK